MVFILVRTEGYTPAQEVVFIPGRAAACIVGQEAACIQDQEEDCTLDRVEAYIRVPVAGFIPVRLQMILTPIEALGAPALQEVRMPIG